MAAPFRIRPLRKADDQPTYAGLYDPHRHDFQEVIIITQGGAYHRIDWEDHDLTGPHAVLVAQGKVHLFKTMPGTRGWVLEFAPEILPQTNSWLFSHFFALANVPLDDEPCRKRIQALCGLMEDFQGAQAGPGEGLVYLLAALLSMLEGLLQRAALQGKPDRSSDFHILKEFMGVLDAHYRVEKDLAFYTQRLRINPRRLASVCRKLMGRTPSGLLEERCMVEAKRFLVQSDLSVQQIAFELGYEDPSYFTKVFRKVVKATPKGFRATWETANL